jgi:hypothetical protein
VIHAVANNPLGPFVFFDVAVPVWAHNPQAVRHIDGTYLLYSIGFSSPVRASNCSAAGAAAAAGLGGHPPETMTLHAAASPYGPWTRVPYVLPDNETNPSAVVAPDGPFARDVLAGHRALLLAGPPRACMVVPPISAHQVHVHQWGAFHFAIFLTDRSRAMLTIDSIVTRLRSSLSRGRASLFTMSAA